MDQFSFLDENEKQKLVAKTNSNQMHAPNNSMGQQVESVVDDYWAQDHPGGLGPQPMGQPQQQESGYLDAALRGAKAQAAGALGGQADFVSGVLGTDGEIGNALQGVMQNNNRKRNYTFEYITKSFGNAWQYATDPEGLAYDVGGGFGSSGVLGMEGLAIAAALPASVTTGIGAGIAGAAARAGIPWLGKVMNTPAGKALIGNVLKTPLEGISEGGNVYREMTHDEYGNPIANADKDAARRAMYTDAAMNSALLTFTNTLESMGLGSLIAGAGGKNVFMRSLKGAVGDFMQNGFEEGAQQGISQYSQGKGTLGQILNPAQWSDEQKTEALIGGITGLGQGAIMTGGGTAVNKIFGNNAETEEQTVEQPEQPQPINQQQEYTPEETEFQPQEVGSNDLVNKVRALKGQIPFYAEDGTNCMRTMGIALAGTPYEGQINVDQAIATATELGQLMDPETYIPRPGDLAVNEDGNHIVMVTENGGTIQNGKSANGVYESDYSAEKMSSDGKVKYYIRTSDYSNGGGGPVASPLGSSNELDYTDELNDFLSSTRDMNIFDPEQERKERQDAIAREQAELMGEEDEELERLQETVEQYKRATKGQANNVGDFRSRQTPDGYISGLSDNELVKLATNMRGKNVSKSTAQAVRLELARRIDSFANKTNEQKRQTTRSADNLLLENQREQARDKREDTLEQRLSKARAEVNGKTANDFAIDRALDALQAENDAQMRANRRTDFATSPFMPSTYDTNPRGTAGFRNLAEAEREATGRVNTATLSPEELARTQDIADNTRGRLKVRDMIDRIRGERAQAKQQALDYEWMEAEHERNTKGVANAEDVRNNPAPNVQKAAQSRAMQDVTQRAMAGDHGAQRTFDRMGKDVKAYLMQREIDRLTNESDFENQLASTPDRATEPFIPAAYDRLRKEGRGGEYEALQERIADKKDPKRKERKERLQELDVITRKFKTECKVEAQKHGRGGIPWNFCKELLESHRKHYLEEFNKKAEGLGLEDNVKDAKAEMDKYIQESKAEYWEPLYKEYESKEVQNNENESKNEQPQVNETRENNNENSEPEQVESNQGQASKSTENQTGEVREVQIVNGKDIIGKAKFNAEKTQNRIKFYHYPKDTRVYDTETGDIVFRVDNNNIKYPYNVSYTNYNDKGEVSGFVSSPNATQEEAERLIEQLSERKIPKDNSSNKTSVKEAGESTENKTELANDAYVEKQKGIVSKRLKEFVDGETEFYYEFDDALRALENKVAKRVRDGKMSPAAQKEFDKVVQNARTKSDKELEKRYSNGEQQKLPEDAEQKIRSAYWPKELGDAKRLGRPVFTKFDRNSPHYMLEGITYKVGDKKITLYSTDGNEISITVSDMNSEISHNEAVYITSSVQKAREFVEKNDTPEKLEANSKERTKSKTVKDIKSVQVNPNIETLDNGKYYKVEFGKDDIKVYYSDGLDEQGLYAMKGKGKINTEGLFIEYPLNDESLDWIANAFDKKAVDEYRENQNSEQPQAEYKYYMNERGASPGAVPDGFTRIDDNDKGGKYGAIYYSKPLTKNEIAAYELTPDINNAKQDTIQDFGNKIGGARKDKVYLTDPFKPKAEKKKAKTDNEKELPEWRKPFNVYKDDLMGGVEKPYQVRFKQRPGSKMPWAYRALVSNGYATEQEAETAIKAAVYMQNFTIGQSGSADNPNFTIEKRIGAANVRKYFPIKDGFKTREEAQKYAVQHIDEILATKTYYGEADLATPLIKSWQDARTGDAKDRLKGKNATAQMFADEFGFYGVQFGNWNNQQERQEVMNAAYEGLHDLAEALGLPPKIISLNGNLGLAFGARGQGLSGAKAHFEPMHLVINLTKMKGAGSLAHEWMHAVDQFLLIKGGIITLNRDAEGKLLDKNALSKASELGYNFGRAKLNKELSDSFKNLMNSMLYKDETFTKDQNLIDKRINYNKEALDQELNRLRKYVAEERRYGSRKTPATAEQLKEFDELATRIAQSEEEPKYDFGVERYTTPDIEALGVLVKKITGRGFAKDNGTAATLVHRIRMGRTLAREKQNAIEQSEGVRQVPTDYKAANMTIDSGRATDYWTKPTEMLSRAFSAFVEDELKGKGYTSDFLSYGSDNRLCLFGKPFPEGKERERINENFKEFFKEVAKEVERNQKENGEIKFSIKPAEWGAKEEYPTGERTYGEVLEEIVQAFPNAKVETKNGLLVFSLPNGSKFQVSVKKNIILNAKQQKKALASHGVEEGQVQGYWRKLTTNGVERMLAVSKSAEKGTAFHEAMHAAIDLALTEKEQTALTNYYNKLAEKQGRDVEEVIADAYRDWVLARQKGQGTTFGKLWRKIKDFCTKIKALFDKGAEVQSIFQDVESGKVYERGTSGVGVAKGKGSVSSSDKRIQGMNYTVGEAEELLKEDVAARLQEIADAYGIDVSMVDAKLHGSRVRQTARTDSDLDLVVEYKGDIREDELFNALNEEPLTLDGVQVDINPITASDTGTLESYMARDKEYDRQQQINTPAFKKWFKNSKLVDKNGKPLVLYRGISEPYNVDKQGEVTWLSESKEQADSYRNYGAGSELLAVYARVENPLYLGNSWTEQTLTSLVKNKLRPAVDKAVFEDKRISRAKGLELHEKLDKMVKNDDKNYVPLFEHYNENPEVLAVIKEAGYDAIQVDEGENTTYGVIGKSNVKSATDNNGDFSADNDDIRYSVAKSEPKRTVTRQELQKAVENIVPLKVEKDYRSDAYRMYNRKANVGFVHAQGSLNELNSILGMYVDTQKKLSDNSELRDELLKNAWDYQQDQKKARKFANAELSEQVKEGAAYFGRLYATDKDQAKALFPKYFAAFERAVNADKALKAKVNSYLETAEAFYKQTPEGRAKAGLTQLDETPTTWKEKVKTYAKQAYVDWFDDKDVLRRVEREIETITGEKVKTDDSAYFQARVSNSSAASRVDMVVNGPKTKWGKAVAKNSPERKAWYKALNSVYRGAWKHDVCYQDIVDKVQNVSDNYLKQGNFKNGMDALGSYLLANRFLEIWETKPNYKASMSKETAEKVVANAPKAIKEAADLYYKFDDNLIGVMNKEGMLSDEGLKGMRQYTRYCPLFRDFADEAAFDKFMSSMSSPDSFINLSNGIKALTEEGSDRTVLDDPTKSMLRMTASILGKVEKNKVGQKFVALSERSNVGQFVIPAVDPKTGKQLDTSNPQFSRFTVWENGEKKAYITLPEVYDVLENTTHASAYAALLDNMIARGASSTLRKGATISMGFMIRNFIRDTIGATLNSKNGFIPLKDSIRGMNLLLNDAEFRNQYLASGANMAGYFKQDAKSLENMLDEMAGNGWWQKSTLLDKLHMMWEHYEQIGELIEQGTRAGEFKKALEKNKSLLEAAIDAKEVTLDFSRAGAKGRQYNRIIPFFNAVLQGGDKMVRTAIDNPQKTMAMCATLSLATMLLWAINHDDDWYKELDNESKYSNWHFHVGDKHIKIPKPQEFGMLSCASVEAVLEQMFEKNPKAMSDWASQFVETMTPSLLPALYRPILEVCANYDYHFQSAIVGKKYQNLVPEAQINSNTSEFAKLAGRMAGYSPIKIDHLVRGYFGGAGAFVARIPNKVLADGKQPAKYWNEMPVINEFIENDFAHSKSVNNFYEILDAANKQHTTYGKKGNPSADIVNIRKYGTIISGLRKDIQKITANSVISPDRKRQLIENKKQRINQVARKAIEKYGAKYL